MYECIIYALDITSFNNSHGNEVFFVLYWSKNYENCFNIWSVCKKVVTPASTQTYFDFIIRLN